MTSDTDDKAPAEKPDFELPDGYASEADFLDELRKLFYDDVQFDQLNRDAAIEDLQFMVGNQWDDAVRLRRETARKPVLTINRLPAFVAQIIGARRQNETTIKILPDNGGTKDIAKVRQGLLRSIQKTSRADIAYDKALEGSVICGIGNFQASIDYDSDDVFEQSIRVDAINDHLSVVWDRTLTEGTGSDAKHVFVIDSIPHEDFKTAYPWATPADVMTDTAVRGDLRMNGWVTSDDVRVVSYWAMRTRKRTLAMLQNGNVVDVTDDLQDEDKAATLLSNIQQRDDGSPVMREVNRKFAQMYLCSGADILEGPYDLPIARVPVFRVPGWEISVGEWKHRWGLIRFLKDPQRLHNYWRSVIAEKIMQSPRAVWLAGKTAVQGNEAAFRNSHLSDNPLLVWDDSASAKPERLQPVQVEDSLLGQAELTTQDIKDVSNLHEASLGMQGNEVSGAAIMARQRVSDTGTIMYHDNLNQAIEEAGRVMNDLIPTVYDTPRIVRIVGDDARAEMVAINQTTGKGVDLDVGKYSVTVSTGPSTATKRIESAQAMMSLGNAMPEVLQLSADLIVEAQDWPKADEIARRIRSTLPPGILDPKDMTPEQQQAAQAQGEQQAQQQKFAIATAVAEYMKTQSETALNNSRAQNFQADAALAPVKAQTTAANTASQMADRELRGHLETVKVATGG